MVCASPEIDSYSCFPTCRLQIYTRPLNTSLKATAYSGFIKDLLLERNLEAPAELVWAIRSDSLRLAIMLNRRSNQQLVNLNSQHLG